MLPPFGRAKVGILPPAPATGISLTPHLSPLTPLSLPPFGRVGVGIPNPANIHLLFYPTK